MGLDLLYVNEVYKTYWITLQEKKTECIRKKRWTTTIVSKIGRKVERLQIKKSHVLAPNVNTIVTANGARSAVQWFCLANHFSCCGDDVTAFPHHGTDRTGRNKVDQIGEEGLG